MTAQVIDRDRLGVLSKIGQGGQGVVYRAPNAKTTFASSMVYKQYKAQALAEIDFTALAAMPALVEESLSYAEAERLISIAAWPCRIVEDAGTPTGFVMPAIPGQFFIALTTAKGVSPSTAEFQHLLNHPSVLAARGITLDDAQRFTLLREVASGLAFLHKHGVCVGDISPKNLLFALTRQEGVYFIDCDGMRIDGVSALPQVETPGWEIPRGEELATIYSDTYKLGLLALRLVTGDQDTKNPAHLPSTAPALLRQIITDTLTNPPPQRPLPEAWTYVLGHAIEEAQHQKQIAAPAPVERRTRPTIDTDRALQTPSRIVGATCPTTPTRRPADSPDRHTAPAAGGAAPTPAAEVGRVRRDRRDRRGPGGCRRHHRLPPVAQRISADRVAVLLPRTPLGCGGGHRRQPLRHRQRQRRVVELAAGSSTPTRAAVHRAHQPRRCGGGHRRQPLRRRLWQQSGAETGGGVEHPERAAVHRPQRPRRGGGGHRRQPLRRRLWQQSGAETGGGLGHPDRAAVHRPQRPPAVWQWMPPATSTSPTRATIG